MSFRTDTTSAIVLRRTNYGETDRIMSLITLDFGKVQVIAKGVRKEKSRLAGGIELLSISKISFIKGKRDIATLVSTQLEEHFDQITADYERTMVAYDFLKWIDKVTEEACEPDYYLHLKKGLTYLNAQIPLLIVRMWFLSGLLELTGYDIELFTDQAGDKLQVDHAYRFDIESGKFTPQDGGQFTAEHIKIIRLLRVWTPDKLRSLQGIGERCEPINDLLEQVAAYYIHIKQ